MENRGISGVGERLLDEPPVHMFTAPNAGPMTLEGTHTYVIGSDDAYVVDPGPDIEPYIATLARWIQAQPTRVRAVVLTHGHPDHAPGAARLAQLLSVPVRGSPDLDVTALDGARFSALRPDERLAVGTDRLRVLAAPGHTRDHLAFWLEDARILFTGDAVLGHGTSLVAPPEGNMGQYMRTLERMRRLGARVIAPGHGPLVSDPASKLDEYIHHRRRREQQVLAALSAGPRTVNDLVSAIYADTHPSLHDLARGSVLAQLEKLEEEGEVTRVRGRYRLRR